MINQDWVRAPIVKFEKHKKLLGHVKADKDRVKYRDAILTEFFKSGILDDKISGVMWRNRISYSTQLNEDIRAETLYWLSKQPIETIIEIYERNPNKLIGLAVTILKRKTVSYSSRDADYPKHSLLTSVKFASNLFSTSHEIEDYHAHHPVQLPVNEVEEEALSLIREFLSEEDYVWLNKYQKNLVKHNEVNNARYTELLNSVKDMLIENEVYPDKINENEK